MRFQLIYSNIVVSLKFKYFFFSDRKEQNYEIEVIQTNGQTNGFEKKPTHLIDVSNIPKINVIPEEGVNRSQIFRSQSVGNRVTLKQAKTNGTADDTRSFFSDSLLNNISFAKKCESRSLGDVHRHSSGTLARPDIFYQVHEKIFKTKSDTCSIQLFLFFSV